MDRELLGDAVLGPVSRGAGTTSNILYFHGEKLWTACSGDSRAVLGRYSGGGKAKGQVVAVDLSRDHKPDIPEEKRRIEKAGGVVSHAGPKGLPPSRVWVNGRVGLAMSRSIGDGEAKGHGVIPDPEVKETVLQPPASKDADGDAFVIVASDGIWEFISSQQACEIVAKFDHATHACEELVKVAEQRWQEEEGSYRDDITCIIAALPFIEERAEEDYAVAEGVDDSSILLGGSVSPEMPQQTGAPKAEARASGADGEDFVKRRLSVAPPNLDA